MREKRRPDPTQPIHRTALDGTSFLARVILFPSRDVCVWTLETETDTYRGAYTCPSDSIDWAQLYAYWDGVVVYSRERAGKDVSIPTNE